MDSVQSVRFTLVRFALVSIAPRKLARLRLAPLRFVSIRYALRRSPANISVPLCSPSALVGPRGLIV